MSKRILITGAIVDWAQQLARGEHFISQIEELGRVAEALVCIYRASGAGSAVGAAADPCAAGFPASTVARIPIPV